MGEAGVVERVDSLADVKTGVERLIAGDRRLAEVYRVTGLPPLRRQPGGFPALLYMITEQMISLKAAAAIWQRVEAAFHTHAFLLPDRIKESCVVNAQANVLEELIDPLPNQAAVGQAMDQERVGDDISDPHAWWQ